MPPVCHMVTTLDNRKKSKIGVSADLVCYCWILEIEFNKSLSSLIIRLVNYSVTTSLIWVPTIVDTQDFSSIALITPSGGFSVKTLTEVWLHHGRLSHIGVSLSWKMEYPDNCITAMRCVANKVAIMEGGL